ncbi:MAG: class I SAM-dependent methyltransferase [Chlamydiota bacterium]
MIAWAKNSEVAAFVREGLFGAWTDNPGTRGWEYPWSVRYSGVSAGGLRILDAGCGGSDFPFYLASIGNHVCGVDSLGAPGVERQFGLNRSLCDKWGVNVELRLEDIRKMTWADCGFDRIFCISVLEHMESTKAVSDAINEMGRVLAPQGLLIVTTDFLLDGEILPHWDYRMDILNSGMQLLDPRSRFVARGEIAKDPDTLVRIRSCAYENRPFTAIGYILRKRGAAPVNRCRMRMKWRTQCIADRIRGGIPAGLNPHGVEEFNRIRQSSPHAYRGCFGTPL